MFSIGDRVIRVMFDGTIKHGVVTAKTKTTLNHIGEFDYQYSVLWDGTNIDDHFYMAIGLRKENK